MDVPGSSPRFQDQYLSVPLTTDLPRTPQSQNRERRSRGVCTLVRVKNKTGASSDEKVADKKDKRVHRVDCEESLLGEEHGHGEQTPLQPDI